jgi:luciferase family oxidoreductase group 1
MTTPLSVLEVPMVLRGSFADRDLAGIMHVAGAVERAGYRRIWYTEHHRSALLADFSPVVLVAHVAASTSRIRVGAGGVLAPNHAPLVLAEQFGTLAALHPGRVDLGVGRGPGTMDPDAISELRRGSPARTDDERFGADITEILRHSSNRDDRPEPWLLASSPAGATLAARLGLPVAFAHHLRPENTAQAVELYRESFAASPWAEAPRVMISVSTWCAGTTAEAERLARPYDIAMAAVRNGHGEAPLLSVEEAQAHTFTTEEEDVLGATRPHQARGNPETVQRSLHELSSRLGADELLLVTSIHNADDRARSLTLSAAPQE